jgi:thiamine biosynthesis lipoprotein
MDQNLNIRLHRHLAMGTEFLLYADATEMDETAERTIVQAVFAEVDRVEAIFSRFQPSSEISRINRMAALGPVVTDPEVFHLLVLARSLWQLTHGAFDVSLGRVSQAWGFAHKAPHLPDPEELTRARAASGMAQVALDAEWRTVEFLVSGLELDMGALAKGYAVDCALHILRMSGVAALVNAGNSSVAATGEPFATGWLVEVAAPAGPGCSPETISRVPLHTNAMGSSGIMEQKLEQGGQTFSHLFDPRSVEGGQGEQATGAQLLQTSVLAPNAALADALSTAMFVLGPVEGAAVLASFPATVKHNWPALCQ